MEIRYSALDQFAEESYGIALKKDTAFYGIPLVETILLKYLPVYCIPKNFSLKRRRIYQIR